MRSDLLLGFFSIASLRHSFRSQISLQQSFIQTEKSVFENIQVWKWIWDLTKLWRLHIYFRILLFVIHSLARWVCSNHSSRPEKSAVSKSLSLKIGMRSTLKFPFLLSASNRSLPIIMYEKHRKTPVVHRQTKFLVSSGWAYFITIIHQFHRMDAPVGWDHVIGVSCQKNILKASKIHPRIFAHVLC